MHGRMAMKLGKLAFEVVLAYEARSDFVVADDVER
jgi:hypothetical protein